MKLKRAVTGLAALTCATAVHAQSAGKFFVSTGWLHFVPQDSSDPLKLDSIGGTPINQPQAGTGAGVSTADTVGFTAGYFVTDHIATEFVMGIPPDFDLNGTGTLTPFGKLGEARQWSPTLLFKYYFNAPQAKLRPSLGIGVARVWFTGAKITNTAFEQNVLHGPTSVDTDSSWSPVFNAGFPTRSASIGSRPSPCPTCRSAPPPDSPRPPARRSAISRSSRKPRSGLTRSSRMPISVTSSRTPFPARLHVRGSTRHQIPGRRAALPRRR